MTLSFKQFAKQVHDHLIQANSKQIYDLADILSELNNKRDIPVKNLFEAMFVFLDFEEKTAAHAGREFSTHEVEAQTSKYPMTLFAGEGAEAFNFRFEYQSSYFTNADIELFIAKFQTLLKSISENMDQPIIELMGGVTNASLLMEEDAIDFNF